MPVKIGRGHAKQRKYKQGCRPVFPVLSTRKVSSIAYNKKKLKLKQLIGILYPCVYKTFLCGLPNACSGDTTLMERARLSPYEVHRIGSHGNRDGALLTEARVSLRNLPRGNNTSYV